MVIQPIAPPPLTSSLYHHGHHETHDSHHHRILTPNSLPLIAVPVAIILILIVTFSLLILFCRAKSKQSRLGSSSNGSIRKTSFDRKQLSTCSPISTINANFISYSPYVRSCIYSGKLECSLQARNRGAQVFTYKELQLATDGFSEKNVIGTGGFWVVFRGTLRDGTVAAIKLLHRDGVQGERDFRAEVELLSRLHSRYLVGLLGYCADEHHRLLVFELMPNGNLRHHLHPKLYSNKQQQQQQQQHVQPLDWWARLRIALDCARGLEFLHERTVPAVIHRDFRCSNVLLDNNYRAKVSDFGIAKIGSDKINGQVQTRVIGTTGYLAPEYASSGKLTTKSDVYSYGVVLLELLTGRVPVDTTRPSGEHVLVSWALPRLNKPDKVVEMVDPALHGKFSNKELIQIAAIAAVCVQSEPDYRPLMTDVVQSLIPLVIKNQAAACPMTPSISQREVSIPMSQSQKIQHPTLRSCLH